MPARSVPPARSMSPYWRRPRRAPRPSTWAGTRRRRSSPRPSWTRYAPRSRSGRRSGLGDVDRPGHAGMEFAHVGDLPGLFGGEGELRALLERLRVERAIVGGRRMRDRVAVDERDRVADLDVDALRGERR